MSQHEICYGCVRIPSFCYAIYHNRDLIFLQLDPVSVVGHANKPRLGDFHTSLLESLVNVKDIRFSLVLVVYGGSNHYSLNIYGPKSSSDMLFATLCEHNVYLKLPRAIASGIDFDNPLCLYYPGCGNSLLEDVPFCGQEIQQWSLQDIHRLSKENAVPGEPRPWQSQASRRGFLTRMKFRAGRR